MMLQLLQKLGKHQPQIIGFDIHRDLPEYQPTADLVQYLQENQHVIFPCAHPEAKFPGIKPIPGITQEQVGFMDVVEDPDSIIRRQLLAATPPEESPCIATYSLNTQLALYYLEAQGYSLNFPTPDSWQIAPVGFDILKAKPGFYQQRELIQGHQILLNYRTFNSLDDLAKRVTLTEIVTEQVEPKFIRDRIILIGVTDPILAKDEFNTPYNQEIRGLLLHAQMVSQLVSAVEEQRPLLGFLPLWGEALWVSFWSLVGGIVIWKFKSLLHRGLAVVALLIFLDGICFILLLEAGVLLPLVPSALVLVITGTIVAADTTLIISNKGKQHHA